MKEKSVYQLKTLDQIRLIFDHHIDVHSVYARVPDRFEDIYIPLFAGIREMDGQLQINAGEWKDEWTPTPDPDVPGETYNAYTPRYLNEEWLTPSLIYAIHQCQGCSYPPSMCCLQGYNPDEDSEALDQEEARLYWRFPAGLESAVIEGRPVKVNMVLTYGEVAPSSEHHSS